jgi:hypothetical protein
MEAQIDHATWWEIRQYLEHRKQQLDEEIRAYPAPIPACDAQFNYLMEQRAQLTRDLGRLATVSKENQVGADDLTWLDEFARSSIYLDDAAQQTIQQHVYPLIADHEN